MAHSLEPSTPPSLPPATFSYALGHRWRGHRPTPSLSTSGTLWRTLDEAGAGAFGRALAQIDERGGFERGSFTLFAPSDAALVELPPQLFRDPARLRRVLGFHLIEGVSLSSSEFSRHVPSSIGQRLKVVRHGDGAVEIDEARILRPDLPTESGIIHVIDRVLLPAELDILELLHISDSFHRLVTACEVLGLEPLLRGADPHTLFAPRGLTRLPTWQWHSLLAPSGRAQLRELIEPHIVPGRHYLDASASMTNLAGRELELRRVREGYRVGDSRVLLPNLDTRNGLVHVIEGFTR